MLLSIHSPCSNFLKSETQLLCGSKNQFTRRNFIFFTSPSFPLISETVRPPTAFLQGKGRELSHQRYCPLCQLAIVSKSIRHLALILDTESMEEDDRGSFSKKLFHCILKNEWHYRKRMEAGRWENRTHQGAGPQDGCGPGSPQTQRLTKPQEATRDIPMWPPLFSLPTRVLPQATYGERK